MNWIDYVIIGIIALSALISLVRGFVKEAVSLASWIAAFFVASHFYSDVASYFTLIENPYYRSGAAILCLFIATLLIGALCNYVLSQLVSTTGLSGTDRVLGICFGGVRGVFVVAALLFVLSFTALTKTPWWQHSQLIPEFTVIVQWFFEFLKDSSSLLTPP
ncbi:CvpA family protein [Celerinatantimonas sp. MCCC 1A17872]|uniref:CvpA family protein n=1 Tax=Celerinatantimonas sp. MCCC 1A17872 TaxID=3177514 RepID=UPI0038C661C2